ncbi:unnamed protein product [Porites evermanni]|uniref:Glycosyltransferase family 92 protein n=1 Tax=Porites evermanni TaxID=104178 RepID=A0ABN8MGQ2_9CNID|nr:unnamed protein product [Porites evermanni]
MAAFKEEISDGICIDCHAHISAEEFQKDIDAVLQAAKMLIILQCSFFNLDEMRTERFSFECRKVIGFALSTRCDWLKRFAPPFHPIRRASYFTFYDFEIADNVRKVLKYYESKGLVEVLSWKLPSYITGEDVHYFGQIFAMQDCLFRSINHLNFVAFNDLDEFIVPLQHENMPSLLHSIHKLNYCGHCFRSAKFPRVESENEPPFRLSTQTVFHRLLEADMTHTKCVDDPQRVFEHGVHLIMEPLKGYKPNDVSWNEARVFHYRNCRAPCNLAADMEVDTTMQKYGERLIKNVILRVVDSKVTFH